MSKQYGLILPKDKGHKIAPVTAMKPSIFNEDSDSDTPDMKPTGITKSIKKQDKLNQNRAIEEDPTVYQYDEIYDEMDQRRKESKLSRTDLDKKPKYISRLLAAADKRKREHERRIERQVQKEREEEGEQFKDKESFVTSAYKKKLEELRELEEQEKREEYLESIGDVRKQGNLDGFYRHLYDQKVNYEDKDEVDTKKENVDIKEEPKSDSASDCDNKNRSPKRKKSCDTESDSEKQIKPKKDVKKRKYRARRESEDKSDEENDIKKEHLPSNLDADSDFSIDSSDSEEEKEEKEVKSSKIEVEVKEENTMDLVEDNKDNKASVENSETEKDEKKIEVKVKKNKIDIWKKRTVGERFDEALKRYFERKALREAGL